MGEYEEKLTDAAYELATFLAKKRDKDAVIDMIFLFTGALAEINEGGLEGVKLNFEQLENIANGVD